MRIAVITGGMGGLGESISAKMHAAGYALVEIHDMPTLSRRACRSPRVQRAAARCACL
jgi:NAD(P)-dependent dehydrogenase (short-subunit alcohol dehydrogenase family)